MTAKKICICGWNKAAGKCPYPINCKTPNINTSKE